MLLIGVMGGGFSKSFVAFFLVFYFYYIVVFWVGEGVKEMVLLIIHFYYVICFTLS